MANETWSKTDAGAVLDTDGNSVGSGDGLGTITINAATTVFVRGGFTLEILAGVTVKFRDTSSRIRVLNSGGGPGALLCSGVSAERVVLTSNAVTPAAGDWNGIETFQGSGANVPTITMTFTTLEYSQSGIFNVTTNGPHAVTCTDCLFRHIEQSYLQMFSTTAAWTATRCVFIKCNADHPAGNASNLIVSSGTGGMMIDHCSVYMELTVSTTDLEILQLSAGAALTVTNSVFKGENLHVTRVLSLLADLGGTMTNSFNWYDVEALGGYVPDATDTNQNPGYFDIDCTTSFGAIDLRPDFDTGVSTADSVGALLGALSPYNTPVPPNGNGGQDLGPPSYKDYTDPTFVPHVCDYDFFDGPYPDDWQEALYDRKRTPPHQLVVCIEIPTRGVDLDFVFAPGVPITLISQTEDTITVDIGCWVDKMRALTTKRDAEFREYRGSDVDLLFVDWFGRLDPKIFGSLFYNRSWRGLRVTIGSWIHGTERVLRHAQFFLQDVRRRGSITRLRLRDPFLELVNRPLRANLARSLTTGFQNEPNVGFDLDQVTIFSANQEVESVKVRFLDEGTADSRSYEVIGSESGLMGTGTLDDDFLSDDEGLGIAPEAFTIPPAGSAVSFFVPGDAADFNLVNDLTGKPNRVIYEYLTTYGGLVEGVDVLEADFDAKANLLPTQTEIHLRFLASTTLLEACRIAALHGFVTLSQNARGQITLGGFKPTLQQQLNLQQNPTICSSNDLIDLETENLPVHNVIRAAYNPLEADGVTHSGEVDGEPTKWSRFPTPELGEDFNRSKVFYGQTFPFNLELPGFRSGQEGALFAVLQGFWILFEGTPTPRERFEIDTKIHNLNRQLEDLVFLDCERPRRTGWAQVIEWKKDPLKRKVGLVAIDVDDIVQPNFGCGYAFCDAGHFTDDCWVAY